MALYCDDAVGGVEACGISWRFRGSTNTPFKPVNLPLPVSCGELRSFLKTDIGLTFTPQIDVLLFFANDDETSQGGGSGDGVGGVAAVPLSDHLLLSRPCKVVLQRTSAAAAREALSRADALYHGSSSHGAKRNEQLHCKAGNQGIPEAEGGSGPVRISEQQQQRVVQPVESEAVGLTRKEQQLPVQHMRRRCSVEREILISGEDNVSGRGEDAAFTTAAGASVVTVQQQKESSSSEMQQQQIQQQHQQVLHQQVNLQYYTRHGNENTITTTSEEEQREAETRAADEEAETALLHAVIEKHAEHRGPQQQQSGNILQRLVGGGGGGGGCGAGWGRGVTQQRRNMVWSRDGVGSTSAAAVAATTSIPVTVAGAPYFRRGGGGGGKGTAFTSTSYLHNRISTTGRGGGLSGGYYGYYHFPVDADYICHFCGEKGTHHIRNCTKAQDPRQQKKVKPATGIPNSFLQDIDVNDIPSYQEVYIRRDIACASKGAFLTARQIYVHVHEFVLETDLMLLWRKCICSAMHGTFAVMKNTKNLSSQSFFSVDFETKVERHTGSSSCTSQLRCGLCSMVFKNPVITPCCGETFCCGCLVRALQQQHVLHRFEEQQPCGGTYAPHRRGKVEIDGALTCIKQEVSSSETYLPPAAIAGGGVAEKGKRMRLLSQHSSAQDSATGYYAIQRSRGGRTGAGVRKISKGGTCPACGGPLDFKDVVENVALRKCVDAVVLSSSSHERSTLQALQQKQQQALQQGQETSPQQKRQPQQQQQEARPSVKELRGGGAVQEALQSQNKVEKKEHTSLAVKLELETVVKKEQQQIPTHRGVPAKVNNTSLTTAAVCRTVAEDNVNSRVKASATVASSGVSAARVVVKTEVGAAASAAAAPVDLSSFGVCSTNRNGSPSSPVLAPLSFLPGEKKIQHHEDSLAVAVAAAPTDTHKVSATAASAVPAAVSSCVSTEEGFSMGSQSAVSHDHEPAAAMATTAAPTITSNASKQPGAGTERSRSISSAVTVTTRTSADSTCENSASSSYRNSSAADTHLTTAAVVDGTSALSYGNAHLSGGSPPLPHAASLQHYVSGAACASIDNSASRMNHSSSCCSSTSSTDAACGVVQGERAKRTDAGSATSAVAHASGPERQGDRAAATKSGVLNGLDMSELQE